MDQERESGSEGADVAIQTDDGWFEARSDAGQLIELTALPSRELWEDEAPDAVIQDNFVRITNIVFGFMWNTTLVSQPITEFEDFLRPELGNGQIGMLEGRVSNAQSAYWEYMREVAGPEFWEELAAQEPVFFPSAVPLAQAVGAGEVAAAGFMFYAPFGELESSGAPVEFQMAEPTLGTGIYAGALGWSHHPNAARVFLEFVMSAEGQALLHGEPGLSSPLLDIPGSMNASEIVYFFDADEWDEARQSEFESEWSSTFMR
jgi:iron(III) transport system substrate-binding protein